MSTDLLTAVQKENRVLKEKIQSMYAVEEMQKVIMSAGGRLFTYDELLSMTIGDFIKSFYPNGIRITLRREGESSES